MTIGALGQGRYLVAERLGAGGMAEVWRAWDTRLLVWRAVKTMRHELASNPNTRRRFEQEARAMARLAHPHILAIRDVADEDGHPYLVMDLASGGSLADRVGAEPLAPATAARLVEEVCRALHHAHQHGVVHRDVKPHNVLLDDGRALVSDFGIARVADTDHGLTRTGAQVGTLAYMAPEQRSAASEVDGRADVYAAAATLYWLLTLREPLDLYVAADDAYDRVPAVLADIVRRGTRYHPAERWADAGAMADALAAARPTLGDEAPLPAPALAAEAPSDATWSETRTAAPPSPPAAVVPAVPERRPLPRALILGGVAAAAAAAGVVVSRRPAPPEPAPAPYTVTRTLTWLDPDDVLLGVGPDGVLVRGASGLFLADRDGAHPRPFDFPDASWTGNRAIGLVADRGVLRLHDGGVVTELALRGGDRPYGDVAPDGRRALVRSEDGLVVVDARGRRRLAGGDEGFFRAAWSPDGRRIAAVVQAGAGNGASLAVFDLQASSVQYLRDDPHLALSDGAGGVAWRDARTLLALREDNDGAALVEQPLDGGEATLHPLPLRGVSDLHCVDDRAIVDVQRVWVGVRMLDRDLAEIARLHDPDRRFDVCGVRGDAVVVCQDGRSASTWSGSGDVEPLTEHFAGSFRGELVASTPEGLRVGESRGPRVEGTLKCRSDSCWRAIGEELVRYSPDAGAPVGEPLRLEMPNVDSWTPLAGGGVAALTRQEGLVVVRDEKVRSYGSFGLDFLQHVSEAPDRALWLSGFRAGVWTVARWTPTDGFVPALSNERWIGRPEVLPDGRVVIGALMVAEVEHFAWGPPG